MLHLSHAWPSAVRKARRFCVSVFIRFVIKLILCFFGKHRTWPNPCQPLKLTEGGIFEASVTTVRYGGEHDLKSRMTSPSTPQSQSWIFLDAELVLCSRTHTAQHWGWGDGGNECDSRLTNFTLCLKCTRGRPQKYDCVVWDFLGWSIAIAYSA